jgi:serine/threonine protein kinase
VLSLAGLILLGHKKSEEPYSPTDKTLLQALAGQVAVLCENLWLHDRVDRDSRVRRDVLAHLEKEHVNLVKECPVCGRCFDRSDEVCPDDRSELSLTLPVERVLEDRYRLERVLGRGGMGAVYEASDTRLSRSVAVKIMTGHLFGQPKALRRFEREAQASAKLNHPNVIDVHDYGRIGDDGAFLVMELIHGTTMRGRLERQECVAPPIAAEWFDQVLDGLTAAHEQGIIHRDLKPENIMIGGTSAEGESVKILDFGLAKAKWVSTASTGLTAPGAVVGTYAYMSPEQLGGAELDERSDLFSVGVMAVEAITGSHPFRSRTTAEMLHAIQHKPVRLEGAGETVRRLESVLAKSVAYDPANRFGSARELRQSLIPALLASPAPV